MRAGYTEREANRYHGSGGRLGAALARQYFGKHEVTAFNHAEMDLGDQAHVEQLLSLLPFDLLINRAAIAHDLIGGNAACASANAVSTIAIPLT